MQTLNGYAQPNNAASYAADVGQWRHNSSRYDFAVSGGAQGAFTIFTVTGDVSLLMRFASLFSGDTGS